MAKEKMTAMLVVVVLGEIKKEVVVVLVVEKYCFFFLLMFNLFLMAKFTPWHPCTFFTLLSFTSLRLLSPALVFCCLQVPSVTIQLSDSLHQKLIYPRRQVQLDFNSSNYSFLLSRVLFKTRVVNHVSCHVIINVHLHPLSRITCCKYVFLNIFCRNISIICNLSIEVKGKTIMNIID